MGARTWEKRFHMYRYYWIMPARFLELVVVLGYLYIHYFLDFIGFNPESPPCNNVEVIMNLL